MFDVRRVLLIRITWQNLEAIDARILFRSRYRDGNKRMALPPEREGAPGTGRWQPLSPATGVAAARGAGVLDCIGAERFASCRRVGARTALRENP